MKVTGILAATAAFATTALAVRSCAPGYYYCGWYLVGTTGWQAEELQPFYCAGTGDCDQIRSNLWDSTYYCTRNGIVQWVQYCGPSSCSGADQLCENQNVSDIYSPSGQLWYPTSAAPSPPKGFASPPYPFFQSGSTRSTPPRVSTYGDIESNFQVW